MSTNDPMPPIGHAFFPYGMHPDGRPRSPSQSTNDEPPGFEKTGPGILMPEPKNPSDLEIARGQRDNEVAAHGMTTWRLARAEETIASLTRMLEAAQKALAEERAAHRKP